jgi:NADPH2 dehydrogenase
VDQRINRDATSVLDSLALLSERLRQKGVQTSIRISMKTGEPHFDSAGGADFLDTIARLPFDFVDLSSGFYNIDKRLIYPARPEILAARIRESLAVALRHPSRSFIFSGRSLNHEWAGIPANAHPGLCRDLIANPNFLWEPSNGCQNHGKCHYYSRGGDHLVCARWGGN